MITTSATAVLMYAGARIGHCKNVEIVFERDALDTTKQGDRDATYIPGMRRGSGQATLLYDPEDNVVKGLLNRIYNDNISAVTGLKLVFNADGTEYIEFNTILTRISMAIAFGEAMAVTIAFNLTGKYTGGGI